MEPLTPLKKLILFCLIFFIIYILLIFNAPILAGAIGKTLGIDGFNEFILKFKGTYDDTVTNIPTKNELKNAYDTVSSGAIELGENFKIGLDYTKEKLDGYRETLSGVQDTIYEVKNGYNEVKDYINTNSGVVDELRDTIDTLSGLPEQILGSGTIEDINNTVEIISDFSDDLTLTGTIGSTGSIE